MGLSTGLFPSFTLGCGAVGGSATSDNVGPMHLLNIRYVAYDLGNTPVSAPAAPKHTCSCGGNCGGHGSVDINALTSMIVAELKKVM